MPAALSRKTGQITSSGTLISTGAGYTTDASAEIWIHDRKPLEFKQISRIALYYNSLTRLYLRARHEHSSMAPKVPCLQGRTMSADHLDQFSAPPTQSDRRRRYRARVHWPVQFHRQDVSGFLATETQDLSSDGFYCRSKTVFAPGELVDCTLQVPAHRRQAPGGMLPVKCRVRIVRVDEPDSRGFHGIGCHIEDYHFPSVDLSTGAPLVG